MSLKRDSVTQWARNNGAAIDKHRSQDVASNNVVPTLMGQSIFGLASQIPGISKYTNSSYTMGLSPAALVNGNWNTIRDRALLVGSGFLSSFLNKTAGPQNRKSLDQQDSNNLYGSQTGYRYNHQLESVGYIGFSYYSDILNDNTKLFESTSNNVNTLTDTRSDIQVLKVPFFENPTIRESRKPKYASHTIVNRNEPYRIWTGSDPLKVDIKFKMTLPHLMTFAINQLQKQILKKDFIHAYADFLHTHWEFEGGVQGEDTTSGDLAGLFGAIDDLAYKAGQTGIGQWMNGGGGMDDLYELSHALISKFDVAQYAETTTDRGSLVAYVLGLISLVRASVLGDTAPTDSLSERAYRPPSIAYLTFGALYQDFPCIVTNYNITFDGKAGYEELSLLPRVIEFSLTLESYNQFSTETSRGINTATPGTTVKSMADYRDAINTPAPVTGGNMDFGNTISNFEIF